MKPGFRTSEFWLVMILGAAKAVYPDLPDEAAYTVIAYILSRMTVKTVTELKK